MTGSSQVQDGPERRYTLEELTLSPAERERFEVRGLLMAAIHDGLDGAITGQVSDRGVERCADHILREWVPRFLAGRSGPVRDIPEEMVEKAARAAHGALDSTAWDALSQEWRNDYLTMARAGLCAALAGRTVLELPEPDETLTDGAPMCPQVRWNAKNTIIPDGYVVSAIGRSSGPKVNVRGGPYMDPDIAEQYAAMLLAAAREARRLAAGSGVGDQDGE